MSRSALTAGLRHLRGVVAAQQHRDDSDEQLLHAFATRHDESAFTVLVRRHGPMVLYVCRRVLDHQQDAEDAFQATFLVLARNAAALRKKAALAGFLHGTAYRLALSAKRAAARRRKYEGQTPVRSAVDPADEMRWREVRALLDEEIASLPDALRSVFVLCCLENLSQAEAGRQLGLKERTVSNRLAAARQRLQRRLTRRGVELTALLAASTLAAQPAPALSPVLIVQTTQVALAAVTGNGLAGIVSTSIAELAEGAASIATVSKAKLAMAFVLAASLLAGASVGAYRGLLSHVLAPSTPLAGSPPSQADDKPKSASPQREAAKIIEIQGRVLGIDGKPKAGAKLHLLDKEGEIKPLGVAAADGRFTITVPQVSQAGLWPALIAQAEDAGIDFLSLAGWSPTKAVELRLVQDHAIRGRIVNTEGQPIRGVRVSVNSIDVYSNNSLDSFLIAWKKQPFNRTGPPAGEKILWFRAASLLATTTDAEGRFVLSGVGAERVAELELQGAGIAHAHLIVANRNGFDAKPYNQASLDKIPKGEEMIAFRTPLHGPDVSIVAEPEKVIRGRITDADSGKELPNIQILLEPSNEGAERREGGVAQTDARGRYEFHGIPRAKAYRLVAASDTVRGYLASQVRITNNAAGYSPLTADVRLKKGVIVTGKIIDRATGKSVPGNTKVSILVDNPFAKDYQQFGVPEASEYHWKSWGTTADDGFFRVVTIPGPVILMGQSHESQVTGDDLDNLKYQLPKADAKYPQYFHNSPDGPRLMYDAYRVGQQPVQGYFCKVLDIKPGTTIVRQDILLERASAREVKVQDAEGRPVAGVWGTDFASTRFTQPLWIKDSSCSVYSPEARQHRLMVFYEPKKKLVGSRALAGQEKPPIVVQLGATAAIKGRLLDPGGKPLAGVVVDVSYRHYAPQQIHQLMHETKQVITDAAGAFALDDLIPELQFDLSVRRGKKRFEPETKPAESALQLKPGEYRDLGTLKLKLAPEKAGE